MESGPAVGYINGYVKSHDERRQYERFQVTLPVELPSAQGMTHDVSLSGIYFETSFPVAAGTKIQFTIVLPGDLGLRLRCEGTVIRVSKSKDGVGVAAKVDDLECVTGGNWH